MTRNLRNTAPMPDQQLLFVDPADVLPVQDSLEIARQSAAEDPYVGHRLVEEPGRNTGANNDYNQPPNPAQLQREFDALPQAEKDRRAQAGRAGIALFQEAMATAKKRRAGR